MTWKEEYQAGMLGGVPFVTKNSDIELGRAIVSHEYPKRDQDFDEDMGKKARRYSLRCFVIGDDYRTQRDQLIKVIESPGPHTLVHPFFGSMRITIIDCRQSESTAEGGMARFTLGFKEATENQFPSTRIDTGSKVESQSNSSINVIKEIFKSRFNVDNLPAAVADHAATVLSVLNTNLASITGRFPTLPVNLSAYLSDLNELSSTASSLIRSPDILADSILGTIANIASIFQRPVDAFNVYRGFFSFSGNLDSLSPGGVVRTAQSTNQAAMIALVEQAALVEATRVSSTINFNNYSDAVAVRDELDLKLDDVMLIADYESYQVLSDLRVAMIQDITARGADLARISRYTPKTTEPALVIAHRLYQDATRADEISQRNNIAHPGFVSGGNELEILT